MMKLLCKTFFLGCMLWCANTIAQNDSIDRLDRVELNIVTSKQEVTGLKTVKISELQQQRNANTLTEILRYNSSVVFRDYGNGGVSTASFRGTSATNTQVLWNGIPINTVGNGQTDFNALSAFTADEISIVSGGNSVEHGSGAIGGVVRLDNVLEFKKLSKGSVFASFGSYETYTNYLKYALASDKWSAKVAVTYNDSDNNYEYLDSSYTDEDGNSLSNVNGQYNNVGVNISLGHQLSEKSKLYGYSNYYYGARNFSAGLPNPASATEKNVDKSFRNLLTWEYLSKGYHHKVQMAFLTQDYTYYYSQTVVERSYGVSKNALTNYSLSKKISKYFILNTLIGYDFSTSETNDIKNKNRINTSQTVHIKSYPFKFLKASISLRNETSTFYKLPLVYAFGTEYQLLGVFKLKGNYSTNFRQPTINELFWPEVGNPALLPETTKQFDASLVFKSRGIKITATYFAIDFKNKINWIPTLIGNGWRPENTSRVKNKGVEFGVQSQHQINRVALNVLANYTYIQSLNKETNTYTPFVPKHAYNGTISLEYQGLLFYYQQLYQGKTFTNSTQLDFYSLDAFTVANLGVETTIFKKINKGIKIGFSVKNVANKLYYFTNLRPMPGRNYTLNINYKF